VSIIGFQSHTAYQQTISPAFEQKEGKAAKLDQCGERNLFKAMFVLFWHTGLGGLKTGLVLYPYESEIANSCY
jgi:hypothetical protein